MACGWEDKRRSGVALALRGLCVYGRNDRDREMLRPGHGPLLSELCRSEPRQTENRQGAVKALRYAVRKKNILYFWSQSFTTRCRRYGSRCVVLRVSIIIDLPIGYERGAC